MAWPVHPIILATVLGLASCASTGPAPAADQADALTGSTACDGLADRWVVIQQTYLDRLGDADAEELRNRSDRVLAAGAWVGQALLEQVRDARAVGCDEELVAGSSALCNRVPALEAGGEAAADVLDGLSSNCVDR